jgi:CheY-like chemotaxis protein
MTGLRVLHVDDEPDIREVVDISLGRDPGVVTRSCASGREAVAVAADWLPDIILLDVRMPGMDGPTTLARLRDNAQTASIPVVFMTGRVQSRELDLFLSLGAAGVIPKPFDPKSLAISLRSYVQAVHSGLDALRRVFLRRVNDDATSLEHHQSALINMDARASPAVLTEIRDIAHALAGASGIYGFFEIGVAAAMLEDEAIAALDSSVSVEKAARALNRLLARIAEASLLKKGTAPLLDDD